MRAHVLAGVLVLAGCATGGGAPAVIIKPIPEPTAETVRKDLQRAEMVLASLRATSGIVCALAGQGTDVCLTVEHSLDVLGFALTRAQGLFEAFQRGGLGIDVAQAAVQTFFDAFEQFGGHAALARGMVTHGTDHPVASAYCTRCCGVVVDPKAQAAAPPRGSGGPKQAAPPKAP